MYFKCRTNLIACTKIAIDMRYGVICQHVKNNSRKSLCLTMEDKWKGVN